MITSLINSDVLNQYARAQQALFQELVREATAGGIEGVISGSEGEPLLTAPELAEKLRVHESWVYEQSRQGKLPTRHIGRYIRFRLSEVLKSQREASLAS
jgi:excisionase family DNA binding protein